MDLAAIDKVLTTTRSVRKRLDLERPVEPEVIQECLEIAIQAPTGSNAQGWHFMVVTDEAKKAKIGELYRDSFRIYAGSTAEQPARQGADRPGHIQQLKRVLSSSKYLAEVMGEVPVMVIPCIKGRVEKADQMSQAGFYGSILPAAWSFMLALRARGLGASWTTLHLRYEKEVSELLGIPPKFTQAALLPIAYYTGDDFKPAKRLPSSELTSWNTWGEKQ